MAHIDLGVDETADPGIQGLLRYRPETARPLMALAEALLRGPSPLSPGERELIAAYVSDLNDCTYCRGAHSASAAAQLPGGLLPVEGILADPDNGAVPAKLRALLHIAAAVRVSGRDVTAELVSAARAEGATDVEIHDTVLIAAAFSMYNRYVDGLGTAAPDSPAAYLPGAQRIVAGGYLNP
jgi:uncharacterized peroxidase-related enzyme